MSRKFQGRRYWIVGASSGLGAELARRLDAEGARLLLSARRAEKLQDLAAELSDAQVLALDVTDAEAVAAAVHEAGEIDGIVYSVGLYDPMSAKEWDADEAERMCEANFMGAMRLFGRTVPQMARRGSGHVVLIGSLSGFRGLPGAIGYSAPKAALLSLAESLRSDLRGTGVEVQIANPGFIRSRLTEKNDFTMPQIMEPAEAAGHVMRLLHSRRFRHDFPRPFAWLFTCSSLIPYRLWDRIM
ncbi:SDR family NAD(P)-dependent oxidoreductase [Pseudoroseicyclus tamaricis]|uniref:SDR family NAD(P)-dependent oxidoreductase n=1 Tax=Pseudoroseicyclus tamaricis TaxID=2705421 RepID=A0A6B2JYR7_9RHOB|nr:SDR family NAD(P)-dependent oxidoreductase [Pseudoroseicyclus tamaricis]NDV01444.1 SDR family NAD(P)-dependent oxidoreductase [Pseudoroseicyclus tamaricis]